ncbi:MAG: T9SS type A sorting domain-containing protein [bacterium]
MNLDTNGKILWQTCVGGLAGNDYLYSIAETSDGGYIAGGLTGSLDEGFNNHGGGDAYVVRVDSTGYILWQKCLGGLGGESVTSIINTSDGGFIFTGDVSSDDGDVVGYHGIFSDSSWKFPDVWVVKLDTVGKIMWQRCLGGYGDDKAGVIILTNDGGYLVGGGSLASDSILLEHPSSDMWVSKLNASGVIEWQKYFGGSGIDYCFSAKQTGEGGYIIAGVTNSTDGILNRGSSNNNFSDGWIIKLSDSGNINWQQCIGGLGGDDICTIIEANHNDYVACGVTNSHDGLFSEFYGGTDLFVAKIHPPSSVVSYSYDVSNLLKIFPNPSNDHVQFQLIKAETIQKVEIFDLMGGKLNSKAELHQNVALLPTSLLIPGTYFVRVTYMYNNILDASTLPFVVLHSQ